MNFAIDAMVRKKPPPFEDDVMVYFNEHDVRHRVALRKHDECATVNLAMVAGCRHPDYHGKSWKQLIGDPPGSSTALLKRVRANIEDLTRLDHGYYRSQNKKAHWSFYLVADHYYIDEGMHRTVVGRYLLECNGLAPVVKGVKVTELVLRPQQPEPALQQTIWQKILERMK